MATDAMEYIGFTLTNDVSARVQREVVSGLASDREEHAGFAPVGPFILTMDEVHTDNLGHCDVNGQRRLRSNTGDYLHKIADVLECAMWCRARD